MGTKNVVPSEDEKQVRKLLVVVLCSFLGGHISTAIQESIFSLASLPEGGTRNSRGYAINLSKRVFVIANDDWLNPLI